MEGEIFTTSRINRRTLLFHSGSVVASTAAGANASPYLNPELSSELLALIEAHKKSYAALVRAVHASGSIRDQTTAGRTEERALLAICAYPTDGEGDRLVKSRYLLEIEARGELDLPEHMQALLRSMMGKHD